MINPTARHRRLRTSLIGVLAAGALALAGCGGGGSDATDTATDAGSPAAEAQTVTVWHYFSADNQVALMDAYADMFETAHPGVTVENVFVPYDQMNSKLVSAAGSQTGPDVVVFNGAETATIALGGALAPLDTYWSGFADAGQFPDSVLHVINGTNYAVQGYVNLLGLWYNADILE